MKSFASKEPPIVGTELDPNYVNSKPTSPKGKDKGARASTDKVKASDQTPPPSDKEIAEPATAANLADATDANKGALELAPDKTTASGPHSDADSAPDESMAAQASKRPTIETVMV